MSGWLIPPGEASLKEPTLAHPRSPCFPPETLRAHPPPPPPPPQFQHNQTQPPSPSPPKIMKPKPSAIYRRFSSGPLQLIVPETTDGNCECKHVNSAGVTAKNGAPRSVPPSPGRAEETRGSLQENNRFVSRVKVVCRLTHTQKQKRTCKHTHE